MYRDGDVRRQRLGDAVKLLRVSHWGVEPAEEEKDEEEEEDGEEAAAANRTEYAEVAEAMAEVQAELNPENFQASGAESNQQTYSRMLQTTTRRRRRRRRRRSG